MARRDPKRLGRILKVRSFQLDQARVEEAAAADRASSAHALAQRIASLSEGVAPREGSAEGLNLFAAAHYRERLARSQQEAQRRIAEATRQLDQAREQTGAAKRNHGAVEKLIDRELEARALDARRALANAPHQARALARSLLKSG
ncbi:MAG: hypothetical protein DI623_00705 [Sphingomonas sanxanigenens]|uniref:Flagellar FliJ protein n=1 Tax=Sphingomonas sanxanigenens TaxID=397260 RepID=A0A2W5AFJ2_9SPHN|nr:MAG: hypothetical protein DI623_00705 [Sphingomonas sanxanigenens]